MALKIIHVQLPMTSNGMCLYTCDQQEKIHSSVKNALADVGDRYGDEYVVFTNYGDMTCINDKDLIKKIEASGLPEETVGKVLTAILN